LERVVAVAPLEAAFTTGSAASVVAALLAVAGRFAAKIPKVRETYPTNVFAAIAQLEAKVVTLAWRRRVIDAAKTLAAATLDALTRGANQPLFASGATFAAASVRAAYLVSAIRDARALDALS
jgi:hypothetical protein